MENRSVEQAQAAWAPRSNTGKTRFNRDKKEGESWTELRKEAGWAPCTEKWVA